MVITEIIVHITKSDYNTYTTILQTRFLYNTIEWIRECKH